jgi:hypothetical protein
MEDVLDTKQLQILRDKVFNLSGEYHILHLIICKQIEDQSEELDATILDKLKEVRKLALNL